MIAFLSQIFTFSAKDRLLRKRIRSVFGTVPVKIRLYEIALIHKSASIVLPDGSVINNERLEYLGDAVLDTVVADFLFVHYPHKNEGFLSQMRSKIVKRKHLNGLAIRLNLNELLVSNTETQSTKHIYGDSFEALVGALYLDRGFEITRSCLINNIMKKYVNLEELEKTEADFKSRLIEWAQKNKREVSFESHIVYLNESDSNPSFKAVISYEGDELSSGIGSSKKEAEQNAAAKALEEIVQRPEFQNI